MRLARRLARRLRGRRGRVRRGRRRCRRRAEATTRGKRPAPLFDAADLARDQELLRLVALAPDDDAAILVYADWLEEKGDLRRASSCASRPAARYEVPPRSCCRVILHALGKNLPPRGASRHSPKPPALVCARRRWLLSCVLPGGLVNTPPLHVRERRWKQVGSRRDRHQRALRRLLRRHRRHRDAGQRAEHRRADLALEGDVVERACGRDHPGGRQSHGPRRSCQGPAGRRRGQAQADPQGQGQGRPGHTPGTPEAGNAEADRHAEAKATVFPAIPIDWAGLKTERIACVTKANRLD